MRNKIERDSLHEDLAKGNYQTSFCVFERRDIKEFSDQEVEELVIKCLQSITPNDIVSKVDFEFFDDNTRLEVAYAFSLYGTGPMEKIKFGQIRVIVESQVDHLTLTRFIPKNIKFHYWDDIFEKLISKLEETFEKPEPYREDSLETWFEYRRSIGKGITLKRIAKIKRLSEGHVKNMHSRWKLENP